MEVIIITGEVERRMTMLPLWSRKKTQIHLKKRWRIGMTICLVHVVG
jgi:hypothetical protein